MSLRVKKIFSETVCFVAVVSLTISVSSFVSYAEENKAEEYSGSCGTYAEWSYSNGTLSISGSGSMFDYESGSQPWASYNDEITSVNVSGISYIGSFSFSDISSLTYAYISESVESIGDSVFSSSQSVTLEVEKGSYAQLYADYTGLSYKVNGGSEETYDKLTDPDISENANAAGAVDNTEINSASEVETDRSGNIVAVPYAGVADANLLPDGGVAANGVVVQEDYESSESTSETNEISNNVNYEKETIAYSKDALSKISWDISDGVLTISGSGDINTYSDLTKIPWFSKRKEIVEIIISDNITSISAYAFAQCPNLKKVELPSTLYKIDEHAFYNCKSLKEISIPSSVLEIGDFAVGYIYDGEKKEAIVNSGFIIYGEIDSAAEDYAGKNNIEFVQKIQKNDVVIPENESSSKFSFRFKLIAVTAGAVFLAFIGGTIFYIWQRKGGLDKMMRNEKEKGKDKK